MINWFNMPDEGLSNGGLFEIKELEVTENGTYETSGEMYNKVTVNVEGGGGSSDLNNPILLELTEIDGDLVTSLTAGEIYALCQTGTPYFTVTAEQIAEYPVDFSAGTKYFINDFSEYEIEDVNFYDFTFVMLGIADTTTETITTKLTCAEINESSKLTIMSNK